MFELYQTVGVLYLIMSAIIIFSYEVKQKDPSKQRVRKEVSVSSFAIVYQLSKFLGILSIITLFFDTSSFEGILFFERSFTGLYVGFSLSVLGTLLFYIAKSTLADNYSPCSSMYYPKDIVKEGVYRLIRHPIYTANILSMSGLSIASGFFPCFLITFTMAIYYYRSARIEEGALEKKFASYGEYRKSTGAFIPKVGQIVKVVKRV